MKMSRVRSLLAVCLALCLLLVMLPVMSLSVFAAETPVTLTLSSAAPQDSEARYLLYFNLSGATISDLIGSDKNLLWNNNTVYVDGVAATAGVNYTSSGESMLLCLKYSAVQAGATVASSVTEHLLKIPAGTVLSYDYTVANDLYFRIKGSAVTALTPATVTVTSVNDQANNKRFLNYVTLYDEKGNPCDSQAYSGFTSYLDGVATTAFSLAQCGSANDGKLYYIFNYSAFNGATSSASLGNHVVELRAGTVIGSYVLTNSATIAIRNSKIGIVTSEVTGRPASMSGYSSSQGHWRMSVNFDQAPTGTGYYHGLTIQTNGVTITDKENCFYRNGNGFMFICWGSGTSAPADGATVVAKAGTAINDGCTAILHLPEDLTVKYHAASSSWYYQPIPEASVTLELDAASSSATSLYFNGANAFATPDWGTHSHFATPDSGVFVNGTRIGGTFQNYANGKWYLGDMGNVSFAAGDEMVIKGYFHHNSQNVDTYFEELTLTFDGTKWGIPSEDDGTVHTSATQVHHANSSQGQWRIYLNMTALPGANGEYRGLTVETKGITITDKNNCFYKTGEYFMIVCYGGGTAAPADGTTITIRAGQATHKSDTTQKITLDEDITVQYHAGRGTWYLVGSTATPLVTTELTLDGEQVNKTGIYLKGANIYESPNWGNHLSSADITGGVYLNGTYVSGALFQNYANGKWYLGSFGTPAAAGDTLRIVGNFVNASKGRVVCFEDTTFVWTGTRWSPIINPDESDVVLSLDSANANASGDGIYLTATDSMPISGWTKDILQTWEYGENNGVLLNGVLTDVFLRKYADGKYYVCLADKGVAITKGDVITVQGDFSYNDYTVEFKPITLMWNGSNWRLLYEIAPLPTSTALDFNTTPTDPLPSSGDWSCNYYFIEGGVYVNGVFNAKSDSRLVKVGANRYYTAGLPTVTAGDIVTIDGRISDGTDTVQIIRTNFLRKEDGTYTVITDETYDRLMSLVAVPELSTTDGDLTIVLQPSIGLPGELGVASFSGLSVAIGNTAFNPTFVKNDRGMLAVSIPADKLPSGSYTVTVKRGMLTSADDTVTYYMNKDAVVYVNEYGIGVNDYVTRTETALTLQSGTATTLTYTGSLEALGALTAVDTDSGVFVNGTRVKAIVTAAANTLTVTLTKPLTAADVVLVCGVWQNGEKQVTFPSLAAAWNGSAATAVTGDITVTVNKNITDSSYLLEGNITVDGAAASGVLYKAGNYVVVRTFADRKITVNLSLYRMGDLNGDNEIDVRDLVLQKRYEADNTVAIITMALINKTALRKDILATTMADASLPTDMIGNTGADTFITSVTDTNAGTTVIGMADSNNGYTPNAESFNDFGLDYVIDLNVDRPIKILQLTDTQIIDAAQERTPDRLGASSDAAWATDQMDKVLFDCLRATVEEAKPDLIIMTGDNVYGEFDDAGTSYTKLVEVMESLQIPWAPVYGNHDNESKKGVEWQNALLADATYCLFNARHDIGGNGNYSIGVAKNGELQRVVYMMDTNYCGGSSESDDLVKKTLGFTDMQKDWILNLGLRVNAVAGKTIPSIVGYHVQNHEVWLGAIAAGYEDGLADLATIQYTLGKNVEAQPGDSGFKRERHNGYKEEGWLEILQTIGADGTFFGHQHVNSLSVMYGGIRWTYGLKTGAYDASPAEQGGTLITLSDDGSAFALTQIIVTQ